MEDRETARMRKYEESKRTRIMMATVPHVTSGLGLRTFQADGYLLTQVYNNFRGAPAASFNAFSPVSSLRPSLPAVPCSYVCTVFSVRCQFISCWCR